MPATGWLNSGGAWALIAAIWIGSSVFFAVAALVVGRAVGRPNDGCLLSISNVVLALLGAGAGFLVLMHQYPAFIAGSLIGSVLLPSVNTLVFAVRAKNDP